MEVTGCELREVLGRCLREPILLEFFAEQNRCDEFETFVPQPPRPIVLRAPSFDLAQYLDVMRFIRLLEFGHIECLTYDTELWEFCLQSHVRPGCVAPFGNQETFDEAKFLDVLPETLDLIVTTGDFLDAEDVFRGNTETLQQFKLHLPLCLPYIVGSRQDDAIDQTTPVQSSRPLNRLLAQGRQSGLICNKTVGRHESRYNRIFTFHSLTFRLYVEVLSTEFFVSVYILTLICS